MKKLLTLMMAVALTTTAGADQETKDDEKKGLPLEASRQLEGTFTQGTWMSVDVSPDGTRLVFDLLGDLYSLPIEGGTATRLRGGPAWEIQPRFSPDGSSLCFVSDEDGSQNLWISEADGSAPRQLSKDTRGTFTSPVFTTDGEWVVVSRQAWAARTFELWMYHVEGGKGVQLTKAKAAGPETPGSAQHNALGAAPSPDGRYLYYAQKAGGFSYNADFPSWQIARRDLIEGHEDSLTTVHGSAMRPAISPDGQQLVYATRHDGETGLRVRNLATGEERWLAWPVQRDDQESRATTDLMPGYDFTPDGSAIILSVDSELQRIEMASGASSPIPFEADVLLGLGRRLHHDQRVEDGPVRARLARAATVSPGQDSVAFEALGDLWVRPLPDGDSRLLAEDAFQPSWSPDGSWLVYVSWADGEGHLWRMASDGGSPAQRLSTLPAFYSQPVVSPDGERVVLLRASRDERRQREAEFSPQGASDLIWIPAAGGEAQTVLPARGIGRPHFVTDQPDRIFLYASAGLYSPGPGASLISLRFDGTDRRRHLAVKGPGLYYADEPVPAETVMASPDGRWALAHHANQLYLLPMPPIAAEATVDLGGPAVPAPQLTKVGADHFEWVAGGQTVAWTAGSTHFRQPFDSIELRAEDPKEGESEEKKGRKGRRVRTAEAEEPSTIITTQLVVERPRPVREGTVALVGATLLTMGPDGVINDGVVLIDGRRIVAVGPHDTVEVPADARVEDVTGTTIVPGFVDTHAHWGEIRRDLIDRDDWALAATLAFGVTSGLDVQTGTEDLFAYQDLIDLDEVIGPRAFSTGPGIFSDTALESKEQAVEILRRYRDHYRTRNLKAYLVGSRQQRQFLAQAAAELGMMPTTEGSLDFRLDLTHMVDGFAGTEHSLPIVPLGDDVVQLLAASRTGYTPTLLVAYGGPFAENHFYTSEEVHDDPKIRRFLPHHILDSRTLRRTWFHDLRQVYPKLAESAARAQRGGALVGVGSHGQLQGIDYHWELWALGSGMEPMEVLQAATIDGAEIIGRAGSLGSIEVGKLADLVVLEADPRQDLRNTAAIRWVVKDGVIWVGDTLERRWPDPAPAPDAWWRMESLEP